jgi:hypothetical protein
VSVSLEDYSLQIHATGLGGEVASAPLVLSVLSPCPDTVDFCRQWATSARASSQLASIDFSAQQAIGLPDDFCEESGYAWLSLERDERKDGACDR